MDDFLKDFFPKVYRRKQAHLHETDYCKYDDQILTLFTSSLYFAGLISTFGASYTTRNYGRRASILVGSVSFFLGAVFNASAVNVAMLLIGRILLGVGIGFGNQVSLYCLYILINNDFHSLLIELIVLYYRQFHCIYLKFLRRKSEEQ